MKKFYLSILLLLTFLLSACGGGSQETSVVIPVDLDESVTFSNEDFQVTAYQMAPIEGKTLVDRELALKEDQVGQYQLYEIYLLYINNTGRETLLKYRNLQVTVPGEEPDPDRALIVGYCEPETDDPIGPPTWCGYAPPPPKPNTYPLQPEFHVPSPKIPAGEQAEMHLIVMLEQSLEEIELGFMPEE